LPLHGPAKGNALDTAGNMDMACRGGRR
jgi:hypothetical protein